MKISKFFLLMIIAANTGSKAWAESDLSPEVLEPESYIKVLGSLDMINSELNGSGFKHDTGSDTGAGYILKIDYALGGGAGRIGGQYSNSEVSADSPSGLTPTSIDIQRTEHLIYYKTPNFKEGFLKDSRIGVGYFIFEYDADSTSPNLLLTNQQVQGLNISLDHDVILSSALIASFGGGLYLPFKFNEENGNTGYFRQFYSIYVGGNFDYSIGTTSDFSLTAGIHLQRDYARFEGAGDRGSTNAEDIRYLFRLPIGLKYSF